MANDLLNPPEAEASVHARETGAPVTLKYAARTGNAQTSAAGPETGHELDALLGKAFAEKPVWVGLYESVLDVFFPQKLPPLELTCQPIPVPDRMAVKRSPLALGLSIGINTGIILLFLYVFRADVIKVTNKLNLTNIDVNVSAWKPVTKKAGNIGGGGGGGDHEKIDATKGHLPKIEKDPILKPQVVRNDTPTLAINPAIDVQQDIKLPDNPLLPNIGLTKSPNVLLASNGQGSGLGMGNGKNGGLGTGNGDGYGPGTGGNVGGGLRHIGQGVTAPVAIFQPEAEFSDEARRAKYEGTVIVSLIVDANGNPQNVHVVRSLGMGLDEKALEAVRQYKFKPAMDQVTHKAVPVPINVEVRFRLY